MEKTWDAIKKGLQDGATAAVNKAEELTQLGRVRLDIAATKTKLSRLHSDLGRKVYECVTSGELKLDDELRTHCDRIHEAETELRQIEDLFEQVRRDLEGVGDDGTEEGLGT